MLDDEFKEVVLRRLDEISSKIERIEKRPRRLPLRVSLRNWLMTPPMWKFQQHAPRPLDLAAFGPPMPLPSDAPRIAIVTPSYNHAHYLDATIDSVLAQDYPQLTYHVQDGGSIDGTRELLEKRGDRIAWRSQPDRGQANAINLGFEGLDADLMAYLNSDDLLLPGTLAYVANYFADHPDVDVVYGHRIFIDLNGMEVGRAVLPPYHDKVLQYADYIPQETMFWRKRVWDAVGPIDESFDYAMDWDFILRAQEANFKFVRLPRFLACFRVHDAQKTAANRDVGLMEMERLRKRALGFEPTYLDINRFIAPYLALQFCYHWAYRLGLLWH